MLLFLNFWMLIPKMARNMAVTASKTKYRPALEPTWLLQVSMAFDTRLERSR